jgi:hypothetical protein
MSAYDDAIAANPNIDTRNYGTGPFNSDGTINSGDGRNALGNYSPLQMDGSGMMPDGTWSGMGPGPRTGPKPTAAEQKAFQDYAYEERMNSMSKGERAIQDNLAEREQRRLQSWVDRQDNLTRGVEKDIRYGDGTKPDFSDRMADPAMIAERRAYLNDPNTRFGTTDPYNQLGDYSGHSYQTAGGQRTPDRFAQFPGDEQGKYDFKGFDQNKSNYSRNDGQQQQQANALRGQPQGQPQASGYTPQAFGQAQATKGPIQQAGYKAQQQSAPTDARGNPMGSQMAQAAALRGGRKFNPFGNNMGQMSASQSYGGMPGSTGV